MIENVVFCRSMHVDLKIDIDCARSGVAEPVFEETAVKSSDRDKIEVESNRKIWCCCSGESLASEPRKIRVESKNELERVTSRVSTST